jgi:hypothetical protein
MSEKRNSYNFLIGKPEGKRPLRRPTRRWQDNIKMHFKDAGSEVVNWIQLTQDSVRWSAFMKMY